ncbi:MAG: hypothetical protein HOE14_14670 [Gemmatimonadales bacterium]|mgnify:FL=1|jgi:hypothetical protein|nr:hypothetical protein [Gemmatimonadales bacterium]
MPQKDRYDHLTLAAALRVLAEHHGSKRTRHITADEQDLLAEAADVLEEIAPYHLAFSSQEKNSPR